MKILITGATGFVGGNLLRLLAQDPSNELFYISRGGKEAPAAEGLERVTCLTGDVTDYPSLLTACKDIDIVYHIAAMVSSLERNRKAMELINVDGTRNILNAALNQHVKRFVHLSSVDAVGVNTDGSPANEKTTYNFDTLNNPYCDTKKAAEACVYEAIKKGLDAVIINPSLMIGAWDVKYSSSRMVLEVMHGKMIAVTKGGNSFVSVLDVCRGAILAAEKGKTGERYILGGHNLTYMEFFSLAALICGKTKPLIILPNWLAKGVAIIFENTASLLHIKPFVSYNDAVIGLMPHYYSSEKAIKELGYIISPIEVAIINARDWFNAHKVKRKTA